MCFNCLQNPHDGMTEHYVIYCTVRFSTMHATNSDKNCLFSGVCTALRNRNHDGAVGIATSLRAGQPRNRSLTGNDKRFVFLSKEFRADRRPTWSPVQCVQRFFSQQLTSRDMNLNTRLYLALRLRMSGAIPSIRHLKECHPRCVYQNYSRSMIKE